jgi:hypothetical protein
VAEIFGKCPECDSNNLMLDGISDQDTEGCWIDYDCEDCGINIRFGMKAIDVQNVTPGGHR